MNEQPTLFDDLDDVPDSLLLSPFDISTMVNVGVREGLGIGYRDSDRITYIESAAICQTLLPNLFTDIQRFSVSQLSDDVQVVLYEERTKAQRSLRNSDDVTAVTLVDEDIAAKEKEIMANTEGKALKNELKKLHRIRQKLKKERYTEQQAIVRDIFKTRRNLPISGQGRDYIEFTLPHQRALRLRLFHPDKPEHSTGVDIVYEHYWDDEDLVRIAAM